MSETAKVLFFLIVAIQNVSTFIGILFLNNRTWFCNYEFITKEKLFLNLKNHFPIFKKQRGKYINAIFGAAMYIEIICMCNNTYKK